MSGTPLVLGTKVHGQSSTRPAVDFAGIDDDLPSLFVERVQATVKQVKLKDALSYSDTIESIVAKNVLTRLFTAREEFRQAGKPIKVDTGYHYTRKKNMDSIQINGLMNRSEMASWKIDTASNGACFGQGIYTAANPFLFRSYGDLGLMVARLPGDNKIYTKTSHGHGDQGRSSTLMARRG
jgi:hypothetical protein